MKTLKITFPKKPLTAKQIVKNCDNKIDGNSLLYSIGWYKDEEFYTTEKTSTGTYEIDLEITNKNKTYTEQIASLAKSDMLLSFVDYLYIFTQYPEFQELLKSYYIRTSSVSADDDHVLFGHSLNGGLDINSWDDALSDVGVAAARKSLGSRPLESVEDLSLPNILVINGVEYIKK